MAKTFTGTFAITGQCSYEKDTDLTSAVETLVIGTNDFDTISHEFTNGTASGQANVLWVDERTVATVSNDNIDMAGVLTDVFGATLTAGGGTPNNRLKLLLVDIDAPDGTKSLRVGPQNVANPWQGPFGGTGATVYWTVHRTLYAVEPYSGWAITAGSADTLGIYNPGAGSVTYRILLIFMMDSQP